MKDLTTVFDTSMPSLLLMVGEMSAEEQRTVRAVLNALKARTAGWKLVPVEPTTEMREAAANLEGYKTVDSVLVYHQCRMPDAALPGLDESGGSLIARGYKAMIAAAPSVEIN